MFIIGYPGTRQTTRSGTRITNYTDMAALSTTISHTRTHTLTLEGTHARSDIHSRFQSSLQSLDTEPQRCQKKRTFVDNFVADFYMLDVLPGSQPTASSTE